MRLAILCSRMSFTPINFFLEMPIDQFLEWADVIIQLSEEAQAQ